MWYSSCIFTRGNLPLERGKKNGIHSHTPFYFSLPRGFCLYSREFLALCCAYLFLTFSCRFHIDIQQSPSHICFSTHLLRADYHYSHWHPTLFVGTSSALGYVERIRVRWCCRHVGATFTYSQSVLPFSLLVISFCVWSSVSYIIRVLWS